MVEFYEANKVAEQSRRARFQEQCFLLFNRYQIKDTLDGQRRDFAIDPGVHTNARTPRAAGGGPTGEGIEIRRKGSKRKYKKFKNMEGALDYHHLVTLDSTNPEILASQINSVAGADIFFNLDAAVLSQLKPIVELYKIYPNKKLSTTKYSINTNVPVRVPFLLGEGITDRTKGAMEQGADKGFAAIDSLFRSHNTLGNVMPHNFRIKFAGKDIAWVNAIDHFSFSLSFSSFRLFNHMFKVPDPSDGTGKTKISWQYTDLISTSPKYSLKKEGVAPVIGSADVLSANECPYDLDSVKANVQAPAGGGNTAHTPNPEHFELQAVIRYDSEIDWDMVSMAGSNYSSDEREKLRRFLRGSALVVRLQFKQHTIRYSMGASGGTNAEFVLDLDYAAYLEGVLDSPELDLLKLNIDDDKDLSILESDLAYAKRLLAEVRSKDHTLSQAISGGSIKDGNNTYDNKIAKTYVRLRKNLVKRMGHYGQWLIKMPMKNGRWIPFDQITVSKKQVRKEHTAASRGRVQRHPRWRTGLRSETPKKGVTVSKGQNTKDYKMQVRRDNAARVFEELVSQYSNFIARQRRTYQGERYMKFFMQLLGKGRLYKVGVKSEAIGIYNKLFQPDLLVSDSRAKLIDEVAAAAAVPLIGETLAEGVRHAIWEQQIVDDVTVVPPAEAFVQNKLITDYQKQTTHLQKKSVMGFKGMQKHAQKMTDHRKTKFPIKDGRTVYFTTFGDILDVAIDIATRVHVSPDIQYGTHGPGLFKKRLGILLGPLIDDYLDTRGTETRRTFNLAHVPISLTLLMGWWIQNVVSHERTTYSLKQFIRDLVKDLVGKMLGESCIEGAGNRSENIKIINFTSEMYHGIPPFYPRGPLFGLDASYPRGGNSRMVATTADNGKMIIRGKRRLGGLYPTPWFKRRQDPTSDIATINPATPLEDQFNYMLIYVHSYNPRNLDPADRKGNIRRGIYYLDLGKMTSVIQSCAFTRMEVPYWREMKVAGQTSRTGATMLQDVYDARVTLFGNNIFKVGSHVFVDPTKDGATDWLEWKRLGIGGFFLVTEVEHILLHDGVTQETNLKLRYVSAGGCRDKKNPKKMKNIELSDPSQTTRVNQATHERTAAKLSGKK